MNSHVGTNEKEECRRKIPLNKATIQY